MKQKAPIAPVVPYTVDYTGTGSTPVEVFDGSGTSELIFSTAPGAVCGVIFGPNAAMDVADTGNCFPLSGQFISVTVGPATRFMSVFALDGSDDTLYFYLPGQTEI